MYNFNHNPSQTSDMQYVIINSKVYIKKLGKRTTKANIKTVRKQMVVEAILSVRVICSSVKEVLLLPAPKARVSIAKAIILARLTLLMINVEKLLVKDCIIFLMPSLRNLNPLAA